MSDLEYHIRVLILYGFAMEGHMAGSLVAGLPGARLSTRASYSLALSSGHFVQRDAPQIVCDAIKESLAAASRRPLKLARASIR
jgi:hypothetical protein